MSTVVLSAWGVVTHHLELEEPASPKGSPAVPVLIPGASIQKPGGSGEQEPRFSCSSTAVTPSPHRLPDFQDSSDISQTMFHNALHLSGPSAFVSGLWANWGYSPASPSLVSSLTPHIMEILHCGLGLCPLLSFPSPPYPCTALDSAHQGTFHGGMDWLTKAPVGFPELF